jgi:Domain of Unknown Function (DUF930)
MRQARAFAASALVHAVLLLALIYALPRPLSVASPPDEGLSVELLSDEEIAALTKSEEPPEAPLPSQAPAMIPPAEAPLVLSHARTLFSDKALSRSARQSLATLALDARFEQLCDVEAMEQVARSEKEFRPERAVAYATADAKVVGNLMTADGAAFLSKGHWYRLSFRCETTPDRQKVVSFDFATGGPITEGRGLGDGAAD